MKEKEMFYKISSLNEHNLKVLIRKLYRFGVINNDIISNIGTDTILEKKITELKKKISNGNNNFTGKQLQYLIGISKNDLLDLFGVDEEETISIDKFPYLFNEIKIYNTNNIFQQKEYIIPLFDCLAKLNNYIKFHNDIISKKELYPYKKSIILKLIQCGYLKDWHIETKDKSVFYSFTFDVFGKIYRLHQPCFSCYDKFLDKNKETEKCDLYCERQDLYGNIDKETMIQYFQYVKYAYFRYCKFFEN